MINKIKKFILVLGDVLVLYVSLYLALFLRYAGNFEIELWQEHLLPFTVVYLIWIFIFYLAGLYSPQIAQNNYKFYSTTLKAISISAFVAIGIFYITFVIAPKTVLVINILIFLALFVLWRQLYNNIVKSTLIKNVLFLGESKEAKELADILNSNPQFGYKVKNITNDTKEIDLADFIKKESIHIVVHAKEATREENFSGVLYFLIPLGITVYDLPRFYADVTKKVPVSIIGRTWFLENLLEVEKGVYETLKRMFDVVFAIILGVIALPFFPFIILAISISSKGEAFYTQTRLGKNEKIIKILKFRTMVREAEKHGVQWTKDRDERVTKVGNFLRRMRIDELPQLWNVVRGDLSFIGPRPERPEFTKTLEEQIPHYQIRHLIRPGLTGWAQINQPLGNASVKDSTEKLQYDLYYVKNRSLVLDLDILAKTIMIVLKREGH